MSEYIQEIAADVLRAGQAIYDALYSAYLEDGAIYGETQDGMLRWINERNQIARLRCEADDIEHRQAMIRDFKQAIDKPS